MYFAIYASVKRIGYYKISRAPIIIFSEFNMNFKSFKKLETPTNKDDFEYSSKSMYSRMKWIQHVTLSISQD